MKERLSLFDRFTPPGKSNDVSFKAGASVIYQNPPLLKKKNQVRRQIATSKWRFEEEFSPFHELSVCPKSLCISNFTISTRLFHPCEKKLQNYLVPYTSPLFFTEYPSLFKKVASVPRTKGSLLIHVSRRNTRPSWFLFIQWACIVLAGKRLLLRRKRTVFPSSPPYTSQYMIQKRNILHCNFTPLAFETVSTHQGQMIFLQQGVRIIWRILIPAPSNLPIYSNIYLLGKSWTTWTQNIWRIKEYIKRNVHIQENKAIYLNISEQKHLNEYIQIIYITEYIVKHKS